MTRFTEALVLDATFNPLAIVPWKRAITLAIGQKARVLETQGHLTGATWRIEIPAVLVLIRYIRRFVRRGIALNRLNVLRRDRFTCQYCGERFAGRAGLTLDHVLPRSRGGKSTWENLVTCCVPCNARKASRTPREAGMRLVRTPTRPTWLPGREARLTRGTVPESWQAYIFDTAESA